jgi:hypothetical protein
VDEARSTPDCPLALQYPQTNANRGVLVRPLREEIDEQAEYDSVLIIFGIVGCVLLIAEDVEYLLRKEDLPPWIVEQQCRRFPLTDHAADAEMWVDLELGVVLGGEHIVEITTGLTKRFIEGYASKAGS